MRNILKSLEDGQLAKAKRQLQKNCKSKPEVQAARLGRIVLRLLDPDIADPTEFELAKLFVAMFNE